MDERVIKWIIPTVVGAVAFGSGAGLGFILGTRRGRKTVIIHSEPQPESEQLELPFLVTEESGDEVVKTMPKRDHPVYGDSTSSGGTGGASYISGGSTEGGKGYVVIYDKDEEESDDEASDGYRAYSAGFNKDDEDDDEGEVVELVHNSVIETSGDPRTADWDYYTELAKRDETGKPYIIHYDEFINDEFGYSQSTLTYFSGDNILCDENDVPMYDHEALVGEMKFGFGSNDPNVVYIRNKKLKSEWEILYSASSYEQEVLGLEVQDGLISKSLKHEVPRFKME